MSSVYIIFLILRLFVGTAALKALEIIVRIGTEYIYCELNGVTVHYHKFYTFFFGNLRACCSRRCEDLEIRHVQNRFQSITLH